MDPWPTLDSCDVERPPRASALLRRVVVEVMHPLAAAITGLAIGTFMGAVTTWLLMRSEK